MIATSALVTKWLPQALMALSAVAASVWMATPAQALQNFSNTDSNPGQTNSSTRLRTANMGSQNLLATNHDSVSGSPRRPTTTSPAPSGVNPLFDIFFGEDLGLGDNTRLTNRPNADNARNHFLYNLMGVGTETFEGFARGSRPPLTINFPGMGTATLQGGGTISLIPTGTNQVGRYPTSGRLYLDIDRPFSVNFSNPVLAFGFYGVDVGDFGGRLTLTLGLTNGSSTTLTVPHTINGNGGAALFFGLISKSENVTFNRVTFGNTATGFDFFGFDDLTIGIPDRVEAPEAPKDIPEPTAALGILLFGAMGVGFHLKRQQKLLG